MRNVDGIFERAKQLKRTEIEWLLHQLREHLSSSNGGSPRAGLPRPAEPEKKAVRKKAAPSPIRKRSGTGHKRVSKGRQPLYAGLLSLSGTARSSHSDVSANKNKHLAEIYATKPIR
jgi:hypothetical protein